MPSSQSAVAVLRNPALASLAALLLAQDVTAQHAPTFPTNDATLQRLWRIGMDSSHLETLAQTLFDSIGPRLTGSPGVRSASEWVIGKYKSWGIDARREQYGTWRGWKRGASHIDLVAPRVRSLEGTMLAWSPGTNGRPVVAPVVTLPLFTDSTAFVKWLPHARGRIVMLSPAWPTCRPSDDWYRWATAESMARIDTAVARVQQEWSVMTDASGRPDSAKLYRGTGYSLGSRGTGTLGPRLEKAGAAGLLISQPRLNGFPNPFLDATSASRAAQPAGPASAHGGGGPGANVTAGGLRNAVGGGGWGTMDVYDTYDTIAPAAALSCEDYGLVFRLAAHDQQPVVRLDFDATPLGEQPAFNTIAVIRGTERPDEYVVLSAHLDSWDGASGATDNGTGTLMVMEAMRMLATAYPRPKRTIIAGHWSGEEQTLVGSTAFTEDHPEVMAGLQALFNQDNGTGRVQLIWASALPDIGRHLKRWYSKLPSFYTDSLSPNVVSWTFNDAAPRTGGTDGAVFSCKGTPAFFLQALGWEYFTYTWHSNRDTYDKIVFDDLRHNATLAAMLAYAASEDPERITRERSAVTWPTSCGKAPRRTVPRF